MIALFESGTLYVLQRQYQRILTSKTFTNAFRFWRRPSEKRIEKL